MLDLLRPVARRVAPWLHRKQRAVPGGAQPQFPPRLNFGCGHSKRAGYLNVDVDPACQPDLLIKDGDTSAIPHGHFEEVYANDVLEHVPRTQTLGALLDWASWLKIGGTLLCQTTSIIGIADLLRQQTSFEHQYNATKLMYGNQAQEGDFHHTGFTEVTLKGHLLAAELTLQEMVLSHGWLLGVRAVKANAWDGYIAALAGQPDEMFVRETFRRAVDDEPSAQSLDGYLAQLTSGSATRRQVAKDVFSSEHRLWATVARHKL